MPILRNGIPYRSPAALAFAPVLSALVTAAAWAASPDLATAKLTPAQQLQHADALSVAAKSPAVAKALAAGKAAPAAPGATAQAKAIAAAAVSHTCTTQSVSTEANPASGPYVPAKYTSAVPLAQRLALAKKSPPSAKGQVNWAFVSLASKPAAGPGKGPPQLVWPVAAGPGAPKLSPPPSE